MFYVLDSLQNQTEREAEADKVTIQIPGGDSPTPFRLLWASFYPAVVSMCTLLMQKFSFRVCM